MEAIHLIFLSLCCMGPVGFGHSSLVTFGIWPNWLDPPLSSSLELKERRHRPQGRAPLPLDSRRAPLLHSSERVIRAAHLPFPNQSTRSSFPLLETNSFESAQAPTSHFVTSVTSSSHPPPVNSTQHLTRLAPLPFALPNCRLCDIAAMASSSSHRC
jgi:hypothetical protein